jgi:succinate-semialdehyde dehydrogenase / glutarate-semialdehyde dehydrogenase
MTIASTNPATGETLRTFEPMTNDEVDARLDRAAHVFRRWRATPIGERAAIVARAGERLSREKERYGRLMTTEMGKTLASATAEAEKCAAGCRYYAEHGPSFVATRPVHGDDLAAGDHHVAFEPLGVVLAVMPWNFPFWQVIRFAAPALVAGNVGLLKHASNVPQCALALEELFREAGAPEGVFQALLVPGSSVERLLDDPRIAAATLTGSEGAGRSVAAAAGRALKKTVLELGGSDPFVVMPSADIARAADVAVQARTINNGQSCIAAKRFVVHEAVADEFTQRFVAGMRALRVGDPMADDTDVGPLASRQILEDLEKQVAESVRLGARVLTGGQRRRGAGFYYEPTVLADVPAGSPAYREELFGPVASLLRVHDIETAIRVANATTFGLGASAWTGDEREARRFAVELEAGSVFVNAMVVSDPRFPFGGVKRSGYGRELAAEGMREFVNVKTVRISPAAAAGGGARTE